MVNPSWFCWSVLFCGPKKIHAQRGKLPTGKLVCPAACDPKGIPQPCHLHWFPRKKMGSSVEKKHYLFFAFLKQMVAQIQAHWHGLGTLGIQQGSYEPSGGPQRKPLIDDVDTLMLRQRE